MTAVNPRTRTPTTVRLAAAAGLAALLALSGCKSTNKDGGGKDSATTTGGKKRDPLVYGPTRIPPQNVPLPERDAIGRRKGDPLTTPTARSDRPGVGYSDDPERFKGTFIPGAGSTPAALAAKGRDGEELKIADVPDNRVPLKLAGGVLPPGVGPGEGVGGAAAGAVDPQFAELAKYGVKAEDRSLTQEDGQFVFRAAVPISGSGAKRQYTGVGATAADAVKQVLDQVVADRK